MKARVCIASLALMALPALAHRVDANDVAFDQHLDAALPVDLPLVDERGARVTLGEELRGKPIVLVMGYLGCEDLCPMTLAGVTEALHARRLEAGRDYRGLFVTVDPREIPALAGEKARRIANAEEDGWAFLGGEASSVGRLASTVGFHYRHDEEHDAYAHAAGFVVLTPTAKVSRYFFGVRYEPGEVATALRDAGGGETGSLAQRLVLLCYHFDARTGRYTLAILDILNAAIALFLAGALFWAWRQRRTRSP